MSTPSKVQQVETVTIRFVGDSGDGMQLTGTEFTRANALAGTDLATFPDYPAEIRAPAGSLSGVSGYQVNFGSREIHTPGDAPDVLVAMNPAALKTNLRRPAPGRHADRQQGRLQRPATWRRRTTRPTRSTTTRSSTPTRWSPSTCRC